jgi:hypothetical protein
LRHLQFGPRFTFFSPVVAVTAIGINPPFDTGVPAGIGVAAIDARTPFNRTLLPARCFHPLVLYRFDTHTWGACLAKFGKVFFLTR